MSRQRRYYKISHVLTFVLVGVCFILITVYDRPLPTVPLTHSPEARSKLLMDFGGSIRHRTRRVFGTSTWSNSGLELQKPYVPSASNSSTKTSVRSKGERRLPKALIIGVKKGGTRALLEFIRLHPAVKAVGPETHFFDRHYDRGLDWYRNQMPPTSSSQITMEKTPSYFITRAVPRRVYNMSQDVKLLVVTRDPVTRAMSDYAQTASKRPDVRSFEQLAFQNVSSGFVDPSWTAIRIGVYAKYLERWLQYFPLKQFHFVSGENLIKDPAGEMAKVQDFLGLPRVVTHRHFHFNETKGFPCIKKHEHDQIPHCLGKTKGRIHPKLSSRTMHSLRDFYRPFNAKFYRLTGINFGWP